MNTVRHLVGGFLTFAALFLVPALHAQDDPAKTVRVRFRCFGWETANAELNYQQAGKDTPAGFYEDLRSPFYEYAGPAKVTFYRIKTGDDGKVQRIPAAEANLEGAGPWPLLLFFVAPGNAGHYQVQVIPDDLKNFPAGSFRLANYTDLPIGGSLGTQAFQLQPSEMQTIPGPTAGNGTTVFATIHTVTSAGNKTVYTNNWAVQPQMRTLIFMRKSSDSSTGVVARRISESTVFPEDKNNRSSASSGGR